MRRLFAILAVSCVALMFGACATTHKTYKPPSSAKLDASTKRLSVAVDKAAASAQRAQDKVQAAQKAADKEALAGASVTKQMDELAKLLPPELKARGDALKTAIEEEQSAAGEVSANVSGAWSEQEQLKKDLAEATAAKAQVDADKTTYYNDAQVLANTATSERDARIKAEKSLSWYRWHWWGSWIALGLGVIACLVFAFLKFTGRLTLAAAKTYLGGKP